MTTVTVITLTYNNCDLLNVAINSIKNQKIPNDVEIEYFIVDDHSDRFDRDFVNNVLSDFPFNYKLIFNPLNLGTVKSFNNAIKQSKGEIIIPLSADDSFYDENVIDEIVSHFKNNDTLITTGLRVPVFNGIEMSTLPEKKEYDLFSNSYKLLRRMALKGNIISGSSTYYNRKLFDKYGYFDENYRLLEDYPFYLRVLNDGCKIDLLKKKVICYGLNGVSSGETKNPVLRMDFKRAANYCLSLRCLSYFEKRHIKYNNVMEGTNRKEITNVIMYFDRFVLLVIHRLMCKLKNKILNKVSY